VRADRLGQLDPDLATWHEALMVEAGELQLNHDERTLIEEIRASTTAETRAMLTRTLVAAASFSGSVAESVAIYRLRKALEAMDVQLQPEPGLGAAIGAEARAVLRRAPDDEHAPPVRMFLDVIESGGPLAEELLSPSLVDALWTLIHESFDQNSDDWAAEPNITSSDE
jgi:hypothetical protein